MKEIFENWLKEHDNKSSQTAYNYKTAINRISSHYRSYEHINIDLYAIRDPQELGKIAELYNTTGIYSEFGNKGNGTNRAAIKSLCKFLQNSNFSDIDIISGDDINDDEIVESQNFYYEKDLKSALIYQIDELFPGYSIYGGSNVGVEYPIDGKRIDVLLESNDKSTLLAIELKSGLADFKVFGQISMYLGLLSEKFEDKKLLGCIIAGSIDLGLKKAILTNPNISTKSYSMEISLIEE